MNLLCPQVILFFLYGIALFIWALFLGGAGHGSQLPLDLVSAPWVVLNSTGALLPGMRYSIFFSAFQWGVLAIILRRWKFGPVFAIVFLMLCYVDAGFILHFHLDPEDTDSARLNGMLPGFTIYLVVGLLWYVCGQILLWIVAIKGVLAMRRTQFRKVAGG
jgi:hypothetical protein